MELTEFWSIMEWSLIRGEWVELHTGYDNELETVETLKTINYEGYFKIEKHYKTTK